MAQKHDAPKAWGLRGAGGEAANVASNRYWLSDMARPVIGQTRDLPDVEEIHRARQLAFFVTSTVRVAVTSEWSLSGTGKLPICLMGSSS